MSDPNKIDTEEKACQAIEEWRDASPKAQATNLKVAIEALELNQMYYEQKGNENGASRMERCREILKKRKAELADQA
jgi:hypothetical protein